MTDSTVIQTKFIWRSKIGKTIMMPSPAPTPGLLMCLARHLPHHGPGLLKVWRVAKDTVPRCYRLLQHLSPCFLISIVINSITLYEK